MIITSYRGTLVKINLGMSTADRLTPGILAHVPELTPGADDPYSGRLLKTRGGRRARSKGAPVGRHLNRLNYQLQLYFGGHELGQRGLLTTGAQTHTRDAGFPNKGPWVRLQPGVIPFGLGPRTTQQPGQGTNTAKGVHKAFGPRNSGNFGTPRNWTHRGISRPGFWTWLWQV